MKALRSGNLLTVNETEVRALSCRCESVQQQLRILPKARIEMKQLSESGNMYVGHRYDPMSDISIIRFVHFSRCVLHLE
jgi:hypothetical protein